MGTFIVIVLVLIVLIAVSIFWKVHRQIKAESESEEMVRALIAEHDGRDITITSAFELSRDGYGMRVKYIDHDGIAQTTHAIRLYKNPDIPTGKLYWLDSLDDVAQLPESSKAQIIHDMQTEVEHLQQKLNAIDDVQSEKMDI